MTIKQVLLKAAHLIRKHGWVQDEPGDSTTGYCLTEAISKSANSDDEFSQACTVVMKLISHHRLVRWNDHDGRNKKEVLELLKRAAAKCEGVKP